MKLAKTYSPADYEANTYALWETSGAFRPAGQGEPFSIVMPPPNANGNLHIGHALFATLEDILTRYQRMQGKDTIWIPGADHAGFETWTVFEKHLESLGDSRFNHTRDELYQMTWDFVAENRGKMEMQLRALGASCDWNYQVFTLDREVIDVVFTTFKKLWDDGLIYRGERLVNFCTHHQTSFADIEVEYDEETTPLYYIKYGPFTLATTRPETKFGDTAVAVHPDDKRYQKWVGKTVTVRGVNGDFEVKVVADEMVDPDFGTGVVKITPAHSFDDWEVAQRHDLPAVSVINFDGTMNDKAGRFAGLTVLEARQAVVRAMKEQGLIEKIDKHYRTRIGRCYKCHTVIEPMLMKQWFVAVKPLAEKAIQQIKSGKIKFTPAAKGEELIRYYQELRDWNISRQIPWGIPIPVFRRISEPSAMALSPAVLGRRTESAPPSVPRTRLVSNDSETASSSGKSASEWIFDKRVDKEFIEVNGQVYQRDDDTFDTWFSSGQWPYVVTRGDLTRFYPTAVMETGVDILRAWVARMIMLGAYISDDVPFKQVYLHGLVNDEHNQKMSKSKGNVINPMTIIDQYGADAMRLGIIANRSAALGQAFSPATVVAGRNFCNKLWNIARYVESCAENSTENSKGESSKLTSNMSQPFRTNGADRATGSPPESGLPDPGMGMSPGSDRLGRKGLFEVSLGDSSITDHWVFRQLDKARAKIDKLLGEFRFAEAYDVLYHTVWDDVADWYVESSKIEETNTLQFVLEYVLKLAHPFAPFVTETIWQSLLSVDKSTTLLISQQWPKKLKFSAWAAADFDKIINIVREIRKANIELGGGQRSLQTNNKFVLEQADLVKHLAKVSAVETGQSGLKLDSTDFELYLSASDAEIGRFSDNRATAEAAKAAKIKVLEARLANKSYVERAPTELVAETRAELAKLKKT